MKKISILSILLVSTLFSCSYTNENDLTEDILIEGEINYEDNIKAIINNNCIGCHSNPPVNGAPIPLTTYNEVINALENNNLIERIATEDLGVIMPPGGPRLPQNSIDLIILWEQEGLLEN